MKNKVYSTALTGTLTALIAISAFFRIPAPIPFTLQVFVVLAMPMLAGLKVSLTAVFIYIAMGLAGLPVFATGGGPSYVFQPTFGLLIGFLLSVIPNSILSAKGSKKFMFAGGFLGLIVIYGCGITGLWLNLNFIQHKAVTLTGVLKIMVVFVIPDLVKLTCAVILSSELRRYIVQNK